MGVDHGAPAGPGDDRISLAGVSVDSIEGWEVRIRQAAPSPDGETYPVMHAATIPLPNQRGDFGSGVVESLGEDDVFVSLVEYGPEAVGSELFGESTFPTELRTEDFHPRQLQRLIAGQAGTQLFFTHDARAFCLYVVLGSYARRVQLVAAAEQLVRAVSTE